MKRTNTGAFWLLFVLALLALWLASSLFARDARAGAEGEGGEGRCAAGKVSRPADGGDVRVYPEGRGH